MKDTTYYKSKLFRVQEILSDFGVADPEARILRAQEYIATAMTPDGPEPVTAATPIHLAYRLSRALEKHGFLTAARTLWVSSAHTLSGACGSVWDELSTREDVAPLSPGDQVMSDMINAAYALMNGEYEECCKALDNLTD